MPSASSKKKSVIKKSTLVKHKDGEKDAKEGVETGEKSSAVQLVFPETLTSKQRAWLHEVAASHNVVHSSQGEGMHRHITLGNGQKQILVPESEDFSEEQLCSLLETHLLITAPALAPSSKMSSKFVRRNNHARNSHASADDSEDSKAIAFSLDDFAKLHSSLIDMEKQAEIAQAHDAIHLSTPQTAQSRGRALLDLRVQDTESMLGRVVLTLVLNKGFGDPTFPLPPHGIGTHDLVSLRPEGKDVSLAEGVVYRVEETRVMVVVDDAPDEVFDQPLRMDKLANEVTYNRWKATLESLSKERDHPLVALVFENGMPQFIEPAPVWSPFNKRLDSSQQAAVSLALSAKQLALVHGPPGTGKTTAVIEIILQEVARESKVLACAASNIAVDNIVERLLAARIKTRVVRLGHPARLLPQVLQSSLEAQVQRSEDRSSARTCIKEMRALEQKLVKLENWKRAEKRQIQAEIRQLRKEQRQWQKSAVKEVLDNVQVTCTTLTGAMSLDLKDRSFDVVIIDEAAQALEVACWGAMLKGVRAVLAGDHLQLPPTIISKAAAKQGLDITLFERIQRLYSHVASQMLTAQYRMNQAIMTWSSNELYEGRLTADDSVAEHRLSDLLTDRVDSESEFSLPVLLLVDTAGCNFDEKQEEEGDSHLNEGEAATVIAHVERLIQAGIRQETIGIITPYSAQVALLREKRRSRFSNIEVSTVDGFQGREKEAIIISMVRSNAQGEVGFLSDCRRMNVAVTRARRQCCLIGDSETVSHNPFLKRLVQYFEENGEYMSASELVPDFS